MTVNLDTEKRVKETPAASSAAAAADVSQTKKNIDYSQASAPVDGKGTTVQKQGEQNRNITSQTTTDRIYLNAIITALEKCGYTLDSNNIETFKQELLNNGILIDEEGNITLSSEQDQQKLNSVVNNYLSSNQKPVIQFDETTDPEFINKMITEGYIENNNDGTYTVTDFTEVAEIMSNIESSEEQACQPTQIAVGGTQTTVTETQVNPVEVPDNLNNCSRKEKKDLRTKYEEALAEWVKDPENEQIMNLSIVGNKYYKDVQKEIKKLEKSDDCKSEEEILKKYINEYADDKTKLMFNGMLQAVGYDEEALLAAYREITCDKTATFEGELGDKKKEIAKYLTIMQDKNFNADVLLERMAMVNVMSQRSDKQIEKDKKEWIEDEAKRQVQAAQSGQNTENTRLHFSKADKKAAEKDETYASIMHEDLGKYGRRLVMECPDEFCDEVSEGESDFTVNGKHYKFNSDKFDNWCSTIANTMDGDDWADDENLTLKEGRAGWLQKNLITKDGTRRSLDQIIGDDDKRVGNRELNRLRHLIKKTGRSVDINQTNLKRGLHVLKNAALGAGLGAAVGLGGSLASGALNVSGEVVQAVSYTITTPDKTYTVTVPEQTFTTDSQYVDVTTTVVERAFGNDRVLLNSSTYDFTQTVEVPGQTVTIPEQTYTGTVSGETIAIEDELKSKYDAKAKNHGKVTVNAALFGGIGGGIKGAASMGSVHAKGRNFDGIVNLSKTQTSEDTVDKSFNLTITPRQVVTLRSGEITDVQKVPTVKPVKGRSSEAYTALYTIDDEDINDPKIRRAVWEALDNKWGVQHGWMPKDVPVYDSFTITVDGKTYTVKRKENYTEAYNKIDKYDLGSNNFGVKEVSNTDTTTYQGKGTVTEYKKPG